MSSALHARSDIPTGLQSVLPSIRGVPWWGAVLVALVPTVIGSAIDGATSEEPGTAFRVLFVIGCVAAVLAVRGRSLFTAVAQPPLIALVVALITLAAAKGGGVSGIKNIIINVLLPIAKIFPVMACTFVIVAVLAAGRWYLNRAHVSIPQRTSRRTTTSESGRTSNHASRRSARERPSTKDASSARNRQGARTTATGTLRRGETADSAPRSDRPRRTRPAPARTSSSTLTDDVAHPTSDRRPQRRRGGAVEQSPPPRRSPTDRSGEQSHPHNSGRPRSAADRQPEASAQRTFSRRADGYGRRPNSAPLESPDAVGGEAQPGARRTRAVNNPYRPGADPPRRSNTDAPRRQNPDMPRRPDPSARPGAEQARRTTPDAPRRAGDRHANDSGRISRRGERSPRPGTAGAEPPPRRGNPGRTRYLPRDNQAPPSPEDRVIRPRYRDLGPNETDR